MRNKRFKLFQCCIPTKGIKNGIIIDIQRKSIHTVSNQIIALIEEYSNKTISELFEDFSKDKKTLKKFIKYFTENELVIISEEVDCYPTLSKESLKPYKIDRICIQIEFLDANFKNFFSAEIDELGVIEIKLIIEQDVINVLTEVLVLLKFSKIQSIILYIQHSPAIEMELEKIFIANPRLSEVVFYNFRGNLGLINNDSFSFVRCSFEELLNNKQIESADDFLINLNTYNESFSHNFMLNKSVFIDKFGNIKNHFEDLNTYGKIAFDKLNEIIEKKEFTALWNITKDKIETCKDCEFRYICPDDRIPFKEKEEDQFYKYKTVCNYDPYQNQWN
jgi:SPASM domain peptide maturase of grasp-with-spasm system